MIRTLVMFSLCESASKTILPRLEASGEVPGRAEGAAARPRQERVEDSTYFRWAFRKKASGKAGEAGCREFRIEATF